MDPILGAFDYLETISWLNPVILAERNVFCLQILLYKIELHVQEESTNSRREIIAIREGGWIGKSKPGMA